MQAYLGSKRAASPPVPPAETVPAPPATQAVVPHPSRIYAHPRMTSDEVLKEVERIGGVNMVEFVGPDGTIVLNRMTREHWAAVSEYTVEHYMDGPKDDQVEVKRIKIKFWDKRAALELLARHHRLLAAENRPPGSENDRPHVHVYLPDNGRGQVVIGVTSAPPAPVEQAALEGEVISK